MSMPEVFCMAIYLSVLEIFSLPEEESLSLSAVVIGLKRARTLWLFNYGLHAFAIVITVHSTAGGLSSPFLLFFQSIRNVFPLIVFPAFCSQ